MPFWTGLLMEGEMAMTVNRRAWNDGGEHNRPLEHPLVRQESGHDFFLPFFSTGSVTSPTVSMPAILAMSMMVTMYP